MSNNDYMQTCNMDERTNEEKLRDQITTLQRQLAEANNAKQSAVRQAEQWAIEAKAQRATVMDIGKLVNCENDWEMYSASEKYIAAQRKNYLELVKKSRAVVNHWNEFGPESDFDRVVFWLGDALPELEAALTEGGE